MTPTGDRARLDSPQRLAAHRRAVGAARPAAPPARPEVARRVRGRRPAAAPRRRRQSAPAPAPVGADARRRADGEPAAPPPRRAAWACRSASPSTPSSPGPANEFAYAVARRVAAWADGHFNPVMFHGPYGFGKTHLLNAIAWEAVPHAPGQAGGLPDRRAVPVDLRQGADGPQTAAFKEELRAADLLLIDDVHFVAGKQSTPGGAVPHPGRPDRGRPPGGADRRPAADGADRDGRAAALAPAGRPGLRHRAGRPDAAPRHPGAQARPAWPPAGPCAASATPEVLAVPGRPLHRQRARAGRRPEHPGRPRRRAASAGSAWTRPRRSCARTCAAARSGSPSTTSRRPSPSTTA